MRLADILPKSIYLHICIVSLQDVVYTCKHIKLIKKNEKKTKTIKSVKQTMSESLLTTDIKVWTLLYSQYK